MEKFKIVVCDHIHEEGLNLLRSDDQIEMIFAADMDKTALLDVVATADVAITRSSTDVDEKFIEAAKGKLKAVVRAGVGVGILRPRDQRKRQKEKEEADFLGFCFHGVMLLCIVRQKETTGKYFQVS